MTTTKNARMPMQIELKTKKHIYIYISIPNSLDKRDLCGDHEFYRHREET